MSVVLATLLIFSNEVIDQISLFVYPKVIPFDIVFDEGINFEEFDGGVVLNCMRGGQCPPGMHYKDDITGQIIDTGTTTKKSEPVVGAPDPSPDMFIYETEVPESVKTMVNSANTWVYIVYGFLLVGVGGMMYFIYTKKRIKPKHKSN